MFKKSAVQESNSAQETRITQERSLVDTKHHAQPIISKSKSPGKTRITIKYDVGFSNQLYIRGKSANLSWERGTPMKNVKSDEWIWETELNFAPGEFKVLINDQIYEIGNNHPLQYGESIQYTPSFPK